MKSVRLDVDLEAKLARAARSVGTSQSEFIRDALARWPAGAPRCSAGRWRSGLLRSSASGGWQAQDALWALAEHGDVKVAEQDAEQCRRMRTLMAKYQDRPMDLAHASLVVLAEQRGLRDVFTLDHADFRIYRIKGRQTFRLWPRGL